MYHAAYEVSIFAGDLLVQSAAEENYSLAADYILDILSKFFQKF
jgi:hypothetical protein